MHYIVDGYNFFFRLKADIFPLEQARNSFIEELSSNLKKINTKASLVFDSGKETILDIASKTHLGEIEVVFTPRGMSADDYIIELVEIQKHPGTVTVVSSDKGVLARAVSLGAKTMSVEKFVTYVQKKRRKQNKKEEKKIVESDYHIRRLKDAFEGRLKNPPDDESPL